MRQLLRCWVAGASVTFLAGCSHASAKPVNGPDGQPGWFSISCNKGQEHCEEKAGEVCPRGYDVADANGHAGTAAFADYGPNGGSAYVVPTYHGHMLVKCHGSGDQ